MVREEVKYVAHCYSKTHVLCDTFDQNIKTLREAIDKAYAYLKENTDKGYAYAKVFRIIRRLDNRTKRMKIVDVTFFQYVKAPPKQRS